jgi:putative flippase GtrA
MMKIPRLVTYLIVGGLNTAFSYSVYAAILFAGGTYVTAATGSFLIGLVVSFKSHRKFVFANSDRWFPTFSLYVASWAVIYLINITLLGVLVRFGVNSYVAGLLLLLPMAILSYILLRSLVFRSSRQVGER